MTRRPNMTEKYGRIVIDIFSQIYLTNRYFQIIHSRTIFPYFCGSTRLWIDTIRTASSPENEAMAACASSPYFNRLCCHYSLWAAGLQSSAVLRVSLYTSFCKTWILSIWGIPHPFQGSQKYVFYRGVDLRMKCAKHLVQQYLKIKNEKCKKTLEQNYSKCY